MLFRVSVSSDWCLPFGFLFRNFRVHFIACNERTNTKERQNGRKTAILSQIVISRIF